MNITAEMVADVVVITVHAKALDAAHCDEFKREIGILLEHHSRAVLDFVEVSFIDSSGLGAVLSTLRQLTGRGGDLKICNASKPVRVVFELVRFHRILDILNTREEALLLFRA
jgi:anti-sigma B factor antagonist